MPVELRINNTRTSSITVIDTNVDLTKESEIWTVTVDAGNYVLFLLDKTFYTSAYSNVFTVSQVKAYYANSQTGYANSQTNYANSQTNYTNSQTEAYIFPPLCVILIFTGDRLDGIIFHTVISLIGTLAYIPGVIHALFW
ncbi:15368_t:CDS:2, partial [Gigaspora rosea]